MLIATVLQYSKAIKNTNERKKHDVYKESVTQLLKRNKVLLLCKYLPKPLSEATMIHKTSHFRSLCKK